MNTELGAMYDYTCDCTCSSDTVLDDLEDTTIKDKTRSLPRASVSNDDMPLPSLPMVVASALGTG